MVLLAQIGSNNCIIERPTVEYGKDTSKSLNLQKISIEFTGLGSQTHRKTSLRQHLKAGINGTFEYRCNAILILVNIF